MTYQWEKVLAPEETLKKEFGISSHYRIALLILVIACGIIVGFGLWYIGIVIFLLGLFYWFYITNSKHYAFTDKRMVLVDSFVGKSITSIDYSQITDLEIEQSVVDQAGGWGTLVVNTAGTYTPQTRLAFIDDPQAIKQALDTIRDTNK